MESTIRSPVVKSFLAGAFSGTCSTVLFQPLDLLKTRIQFNAVNIGSGSVRMSTVLYNVIQQDKVTGLWRGLVPSFSRTVPGIALYFSSIHVMKSKIQKKKLSVLESALIGAAARTMSGILVLPFTVLKTRFESGQFQYKGMKNALVLMYKTEGARGLFSGLTATLLRDVPFSGMYFMFYTQLKQMTEDSMKHSSVSRQTVTFACGIVAGMCASVITQPADVVKTQMQLYPQKFSGPWKAVLHVYEKDGLDGFLRGIVPRTIRRTMMATLAWSVYEEVIRKCGLK